MIGYIGTVLVITQMALLSTGYPPQTAMMAGLFGALAFMVHGIRNNDKPIIFVNLAIFGFAFYGVI